MTDVRYLYEIDVICQESDRKGEGPLIIESAVGDGIAGGGGVDGGGGSKRLVASTLSDPICCIDHHVLSILV